MKKGKVCTRASHHQVRSIQDPLNQKIRVLNNIKCRGSIESKDSTKIGQGESVSFGFESSPYLKISKAR